MKTKITINRLSDLAAGTVEIKHPALVATVPESPSRSGSKDTTSDDGYQEMLNRRYTTPFAYDHWGLNE